MRYLPHRPLPGRPYIPGENERPLETDEPPALDRPGHEFMLCDDYLFGVDLYNAGFAWEAHESWERQWRAAKPGPIKELLQGLIQCAAAAVKVAQGNSAGLRSVSRRALSHLESADSPAMGLDVASFATRFRHWAQSEPATLASWPSIELRVRSRDRAGTLTDRYVSPPTTEHIERDGYMVRRTPDRPDFYHGQVVIADDAIAPESVGDWFETFADQLADVPYLRRMVLWETGSADAWAELERCAGDVSYEHTHTMRVDGPPVQPPTPEGLVIRQLETDDDWTKAADLLVAENAPDSGPGFEQWARWRFAAYRQSSQTSGAFWGAFAGDALVGSLGLFATPSWMRFQEVLTARSHRRRGVCTSLVSWALNHGFATYPRAIAFIAVEPDTPAQRVYRRCGFRVIGSQHTAMAPAAGPDAKKRAPGRGAPS